jgi:hypothetical protein
VASLCENSGKNVECVCALPFLSRHPHTYLKQACPRSRRRVAIWWSWSEHYDCTWYQIASFSEWSLFIIFDKVWWRMRLMPPPFPFLLSPFTFTLQELISIHKSKLKYINQKSIYCSNSKIVISIYKPMSKLPTVFPNLGLQISTCHTFSSHGFPMLYWEILGFPFSSQYSLPFYNIISIQMP